MFHAWVTLLAALRTATSVIELLGLLSLNGLVEFRGSEFTDFVPKFLDLVPRQFHRRTVTPIGFGTDHTPKFLHQFQRVRREPSSTFFNCFRHD
jgi:hypothetical protein